MKPFFSAQLWYLNSKHILLNKKTLKGEQPGAPFYNKKMIQDLEEAGIPLPSLGLLHAPLIFEPNNVDQHFFILNEKTKKVLEANSDGTLTLTDKKAEDEFCDTHTHVQLWSKIWTDHTYFILKNRSVPGVLTSVPGVLTPNSGDLVIAGNITLR